jgi:hypothetical protein
MEQTFIVYWAATISALGWSYAAFASLWPRLFERVAVQHGTKVAEGYRIGWLVHWRLPTRAALLIAWLSAAPILAAVFLQGWPALVTLAIMTGTVAAPWFVAPPGMRLHYGEVSPGVFTARAWRRPFRALAVFALFGLVPAFVAASMVNWLLIRFRF